MVVFFFILWNSIADCNGLWFYDMEELLLLMLSITVLLIVECSLEIYLIYVFRRNRKQIITAFKEIYQQFRNRKK